MTQSGSKALISINKVPIFQIKEFKYLDNEVVIIRKLTRQENYLLMNLIVEESRWHS